MNIVRIAISIIFVLSLSACATSYGNPGLTGGVIATKTSSDTYTILAAGNSWTTVEDMREFALLKAAETTLASGRSHFEVVTTADKSQEMPVYASGVFMTVRKPAFEMTIKLHASGGGPTVKDARQIAAVLGPKLKTKK